jgi:hypothetical protein
MTRGISEIFAPPPSSHKNIDIYQLDNNPELFEILSQFDSIQIKWLGEAKDFLQHANKVSKLFGIHNGSLILDLISEAILTPIHSDIIRLNLTEKWCAGKHKRTP